MVQHLMTSGAKNLEDLELIQLVSVGEAVSLQTLQSKNFRLKTFFHSWVADEAIEEGRVDLIPSRFVKIPQLIESLLRPVDVATIQVTPPNEAGFCSLGIASFLYRMLIRLARERGIKGFTAEVLFSNIGIMKVFRNGDLPVKAHLENGVYHLETPFDKQNKTKIT